MSETTKPLDTDARARRYVHFSHRIKDSHAGAENRSVFGCVNVGRVDGATEAGDANPQSAFDPSH